MKPEAFKYEVNEVVLFNQGDNAWDYQGEGKVLMQQEYLLCNAYLVEMLDGVKTQVKEDQISGKK